MNRRFDGFDRASLGVLGGGAVLTATLYSRLPAQLPVHFDLHGRADGWVDTSIGAWLLLAIALLAWAIVRRWGARTPEGGASLAAPARIAAMLTAALFVLLHATVLWAALHPDQGAGGPLFVAIGLYWIAIAQVLPRVRRNRVLGVRTTWTLRSDENWARTHRLAGWMFTVGGALAVIAALVGATAISLAAVLVSAIAPIGYSYVLARRGT